MNHMLPSAGGHEDNLNGPTDDLWFEHMTEYMRTAPDQEPISPQDGSIEKRVFPDDTSENHPEIETQTRYDTTVPMLFISILILVLILAVAVASNGLQTGEIPTPASPSPTPILSIVPATEDGSMKHFEDVPENHWAYESITLLTEAGWQLGCSTEPRMFCPDDLLSRAQASVFLARGLNGSQYDPPEVQESMFIDVEPQAWHARWIIPLYQEGFLMGCQEEPLAFCPDETMTTAQGVVLFMRMLYGPGHHPTEVDGMFSDVPYDSWYAPWLEEAYHAGILTPCSAEPRLQACPETPLSRAMEAVMMVRLQAHSEFSHP